jgi:DNA-binding HxlR family transcriptional regulator
MLAVYAAGWAATAFIARKGWLKLVTAGAFCASILTACTMGSRWSFLIYGILLLALLALPAASWCANKPETHDRPKAPIDIARIDDVIHGRVRLGIMTLLVARGGVDFNTLKAGLQLTDGNLATHLRKLEEAGYITQDKSIVSRKTLTRINLTVTGRSAFITYLDAMKALLEPVRGSGRLIATQHHPQSSRPIRDHTRRTIAMGAWGAVIMSFFGAVFASLTMHWQGHLSGAVLIAPFVVLLAMALVAVHVIHLPGQGIMPSPREERAIMASSIGEGVGLFLVSRLVINLHRPDMLLPSMALVVGLHFLPIAAAGGFRPFYTLGTALITAAIAGFVMKAPMGGDISGTAAACVLWIAAQWPSTVTEAKTTASARR